MSDAWTLSYPRLNCASRPGARGVDLHDEDALRLPQEKFWHHTDPGAQTLENPLHGAGFIESPASSNRRPRRAKPAEVEPPSD